LSVKAADRRVRFRAFSESTPGERLHIPLGEYWPAYRRWIARAMEDPIGDARRAEAMLHAHLPEMAPIVERFRSIAGHDAHATKFFSLWRPPPVVRGCSQAIWTDGVESALVRNYDHAPHLCDGLVVRAEWGGVRTVVVTDCLIGALDGVNEHGLCVALAFGGRPVVGEGFAASMVVRYILQTCASVREASRVLARVPVFMAYTFVLLDAYGEYVTAYAAPDRPTVFEPSRATANHQRRVEWPAYAKFVRTVERERTIQEALGAKGAGLREVVDRFLEPPIYRTDYERGSGTIYTAVYEPKARSLGLRWRGDVAQFSIDHFEEREMVVGLGG
jgi:predicted choloylglycine hydrolase